LLLNSLLHTTRRPSKTFLLEWTLLDLHQILYLLPRLSLIITKTSTFSGTAIKIFRDCKLTWGTKPGPRINIQHNTKIWPMSGVHAVSTRTFIPLTQYFCRSLKSGSGWVNVVITTTTGLPPTSRSFRNKSASTVVKHHTTETKLWNKSNSRLRLQVGQWRLTQLTSLGTAQGRSLWAYHFYRMMLCIVRTMLSQDVRLSVCLSITRYSVKMVRHILKLFSFFYTTGEPHHSSFCIPNGMAIFHNFLTNISLYLQNNTSCYGKQIKNRTQAFE